MTVLEGHLFYRFKERWQKRTSLTVKTFLLTTFLGLIAWSGLNFFLSQRIEHIVHLHVKQDIEEQSQKNRHHLDQYFKMANQAAQQIVFQKNFIDYLSQLPPAQAGQTIHHYSQHPPPWLANFLLFRATMATPAYFLWIDEQFNLREVYQTGSKELPSFLLEVKIPEVISMEENLNIVQFKDQPILIVSAKPPIEEHIFGFLVLVIPLDDDFLIQFQHQMDIQGIVIFFQNESAHISATSRPDLISKESSLEDLKQNYFIIDKEFFDSGFYTETFIHFASLASKKEFGQLERLLLSEVWIQRASGQIFLIILFVAIIAWITHHMQVFTRSMVAFSRDRLGLQGRPEERGDQFYILRKEFQYLTTEVLEARDREKDRAEKMAQINEALRTSLTMVKRTQSQLVESEKMAALGNLVAGVAHEINTPVGIGVTAASFLDRKTRECQEQLQNQSLKRSALEEYFSVARETSEMILSNLRRAADLIRSFKQVAVDQTSQELRSFAMKEYIEQILWSLKPQLKKTNHLVHIQCPEALILHSYPGAFSQIITNLVINSLNHAFQEKPNGTIHMKVHRENDHIVLLYQDDGCGIDPTIQDRIFDPFFTTKRGQGGSGLGLNVVYNLVTQTLEGGISCQSASGQGVTFTIRFPEKPKIVSDRTL
ncbi:MAG: HAMP domain-containing histidine kinase [Magnetococcus sp. DMHC-6]